MTTLITTGRVADAETWRRWGWTAIDVTVKSAKRNAKLLAPTWGMVRGYLDGRITEEQYAEKYREIMTASQKTHRQLWEKTLQRYSNIVFLCYCKPGDFCHRLLLAEEFVHFAREELGMDDVHLIPEQRPHPPTEPRILYQKHDGEPVETHIEEPQYYAGIGSRKTPSDIQMDMSEIAHELNKKYYILRSGGAEGADSAFERGVTPHKGNKDIIRPTQMQVKFEEDGTWSGRDAWAFELCAKYVPSNRPPLHRMKRYTQSLLARDMMQILGRDGKSPVLFVICWTPDGKDSGGTGYATRCAKNHDIPVYNLNNEADRQALYRDFL